MPPDALLSDDEQSGEIPYGSLKDILDNYLCGYGIGEINGESENFLPPIFRSSNILLKNDIFSNLDEIAQLVIEEKIEIIPGCASLIDRFRIIPVRLLETQEIYFLYAPDDGQGKLDDAASGFSHFGQSLHAVAGGIDFQDSHLILLSHSDFETAKGLIGNTDSSKRHLSVFDDTGEGAINQLIEATIAELRKLGASDFHVEPGIDHAAMLMRLHGLLQPVPKKHRISLEVAKRIANVLIQHSGKSLSAGEPEDGSFRFVRVDGVKKEDAGLGGSIVTANPNLYSTEHRVSIIPAIGGNFSSVVRLLMKSGSMKTLQDLNYDNPYQFVEAATIANGLVFICGPTGSGKSTTLGAMLHDTHDPTKKLVTIEDPVEIRLPGAVQSQVNIAKKYGMAEALRYFLRHDPDQIMVAEMRDSETAKLGVQAANTGHVVYTTLHANTAAESIRRLYSLGIDSLDVATTVKFIFAQRLVEQLAANNDVVEYYDAAEELMDIFGVEIQGPVYMRRPLQKEGIVGRLPIYERIAMTDELRDIIETKGQDVSSVAIEKVALEKGGFVPMEIYGLKQALIGKTPFAGLLRHLNKMRMRKFKELAIPIIEEFAVREIPTQ